jgi:uncharacterized protein (UPF0218 family)
MLLAPENTLVAYGMFDQGMVLMNITDKERFQAKEILAKMKKTA